MYSRTEATVLATVDASRTLPGARLKALLKPSIPFPARGSARLVVPGRGRHGRAMRLARTVSAPWKI